MRGARLTAHQQITRRDRGRNLVANPFHVFDEPCWARRSYDLYGVSEDAKRTARVIAAYVSEQLAARGYLPAEKRAGKPKRPGEL